MDAHKKKTDNSVEPEQRCQVDEEDVHGTAYALPDSSIAADE